LDKSEFAGDEAGVLMIDGQILSEPMNDRIQLLINNGRDRTGVFVARTSLSLAVKFRKDSLVLTGIDRERKENDMVLYTPEFGRTTLTGNNGIEIVVARGKVASVSNDLGNSVIPPNG
jgi:hypothetical protein